MYQTFSENEYYLWRRKVETNSSLKRFTNREFLKHEIFRIKKAFEWYQKFRKSDRNYYLDEIFLYVIPAELSSSWEATISKAGNYNYFGLAVLQNSPTVLLIACLPQELKRPEDYRLIRITKSKKIYLSNEKIRVNEPTLIVEEWEYLPSDRIYVDVPYEKQIVQKLIKENITPDNRLSLAFQSPVISAPYVYGSVGGISLSSIAGDSSFAKELIKSIHFMVPPEYRGLPPPEKTYLGGKFEYLDGIKFHLAERPFSDNNILSGVSGLDYSEIYQESLRRIKFSGEYSIFSTLSPIYSNVTHVWKELLRNFAGTDITIPVDLDELYYTDIDVTKLRKVIKDSDLWIQIVNTRQFLPSLNEKNDMIISNILNRLKDDFDILLSDVYKNETERENLVRYMMYPTQYNVKRLSQSFARSDERTNLVDNDFLKARSMIVDNFYGFIHHPRFEKIRMQIERKKEDLRYSAIETDIINNPRTTLNDIYDSVKSTNLFKDIYDIQNYLQWLHEKGFVIKDQDKRYIWLGPK